MEKLAVSMHDLRPFPGILAGAATGRDGDDDGRRRLIVWLRRALALLCAALPTLAPGSSLVRLHMLLLSLSL